MWADSGYGGAPIAVFVRTAAAITLEVVRRTSPHSFQVVRRRWVIERTFGWLMRYRRLGPETTSRQASENHRRQSRRHEVLYQQA
jgi:transposase